MPQQPQKPSFFDPLSGHPAGVGLGAGALSAVLYLAIQLASPGALIFAYLSPLPLYCVGLSLGTTAAMTAALTGTALAFVFGGTVDGLSYGLLNAGPAVLLIRLALQSRNDETGQTEWYPLGRLVAWLSVGAAIFFAGALTLAAVTGNGLWDGVALFLDNMVSGLASDTGREPAPELRQLTAQASTWLPAMIGISWMTMQVINASLAQGLARRFGRNLRPSPDLAHFDVPGLLVYAVVAAGAASMLDGSLGLIARTLAVFAAYPFFFAGLAVVHALARRLSARNILLAVFYVLLIMLGWPFLLVTGLGLMDQWIDFRKRFASAGNDLDNGPLDGS